MHELTLHHCQHRPTTTVAVATRIALYFCQLIRSRSHKSHSQGHTSRFLLNCQHMQGAGCI
jgi:hypothetical protein